MTFQLRGFSAEQMRVMQARCVTETAKVRTERERLTDPAACFLPWKYLPIRRHKEMLWNHPAVQGLGFAHVLG